MSSSAAILTRNALFVTVVPNGCALLSRMRWMLIGMASGKPARNN
jgi:hypothetical protein